MIAVDVGSLTWDYDAGTNSMFATLSDAKLPVNNDTPINAVCSISQIIKANNRTTITGIRAYMFYDYRQIYIRDSGYTDATAFTSAVTGQTLAYELATPTTSSVTPTNLPIKSLSGYNHIESSTGEMEIEYITGEYQPLVDLIQSGNGHTYSTQEQVVGKWIDGRPIYERTFVVPNFSATSVASGTFYEGVLDLSTEFADVERSWGCIDSSYIELQDTTTRIVNFVDTQNPKQPTVQFLGAARTGTLTLTMQYLKSTNATRSLSAPVTSQKAQIEPLTDKTEEVPTEEEKAVNEEENNDETR